MPRVGRGLCVTGGRALAACKTLGENRVRSPTALDPYTMWRVGRTKSSWCSQRVRWQSSDSMDGLTPDERRLRERLLAEATLKETTQGYQSILEESRRKIETLKNAAHAESVLKEHGKDGVGTTLGESGAVPKASKATPLTNLLKQRLAISPMTVAEYMTIALNHPEHGYYQTREVFGTQGDFTTAPEISQMFGEIMGIWVLYTWQLLGCPAKVQLIELGPGRGTMMLDIMRTCGMHRPFLEGLTVHLVEASAKLKKLQSEKLVGETAQNDAGNRVQGGVTIPFSWHDDFSKVPVIPGACSIILAQEFFDCLPVHQFVHTERGWCEKMVDIAPSDSPDHLRFVLSNGPTAASKMCLLDSIIPNLASKKLNEGVELSPQSWYIARQIATRVRQSEGAALIVDYGNNECAADTLQAVKNHKFVPVLEEPGECDLTSHVDFSAIKRSALQDLLSKEDVAKVSQSAVDKVSDAVKAYQEKLSVLESEAKSKSLSQERIKEAFEQLREQVSEGDVSSKSAAAGTGAGTARGEPGDVLVHGPVTQCAFLHAMGIRERAQALYSASQEEEQQQKIIKQYERLTAPEEMGELFKVMAITCSKLKQVAGIEEPQT
uniref:type II protein arginine methyltransferase n=1 Tax=Guillardia theta TaxID=55529 RepID=A0A7S4NF64_GUITH|mmetsp:Transcript_20787/g.69407  ORF Transcript_20787/g.69407 Transcript_20787/m.69407 type:complete len:606 (+) Transcript_20787:59-1876(+)